MSSDPVTTRVAPLVERLVEERDPAQRDRELVRASHALGLAAGTSLWSEGSDSRGRADWRCMLVEGEAASLPAPWVVVAVADGAVEEELPGGKVVLVAGTAPHRCALALGGFHGEEADLDLVQALLLCRSTLGRSEGDPESELPERVLPPIPRAAVPAGEAPTADPLLPGELRHLLSCIRSTQQLLETPLADAADRERLREVLERECLRAGDLLLGPSGAAPSPASRSLTGVLRDVVEAQDAANRLARLHVEVDDQAAPGRFPCELSLDAWSRVLHHLLHAARQSCARNGNGMPGRLQIDWRGQSRDGRAGMLLRLACTASGDTSTWVLRQARHTLTAAGAELDLAASRDGGTLLEVWIPRAA